MATSTILAAGAAISSAAGAGISYKQSEDAEDAREKARSRRKKQREKKEAQLEAQEKRRTQREQMDPDQRSLAWRANAEGRSLLLSDEGSGTGSKSETLG